MPLVGVSIGALSQNLGIRNGLTSEASEPVLGICPRVLSSHSEFPSSRATRTFVASNGSPLLLRLVGCLPRRDGAAARAAGVRQASKEETAAHRAGAADVMGIVASASGAEPLSLTRSGVGECAVKSTANPAKETIEAPAARKTPHGDHRRERHSERRCAECSGHRQCHDGHERAGGRS